MGARSLGFILLGAVLVAPLHAETASTEDVYACAALENDADRLACYDTAVGRLQQAEEAGDITTVSRTEVETVQKEAFGFSLPSLPTFGRNSDEAAQPKQVDRIELAVASISETALGKLIVRLENGQVWEQTDSDRVYYSKRKGVESAEVKRAAFGSFRMKLDGGRAFRVKRVE